MTAWCPLLCVAGVRLLALLLLLLCPCCLRAQHHHQQQQDPGAAASGGRRALVTVSLNMQDRHGKYSQQEVTLWGAFSPLAAAASAEGKVIQVSGAAPGDSGASTRSLGKGVP